MTTRTIARRVALAGGALAAALALTACGSDDHASPGHDTPSAATGGAPASGSATFGDADVMFAQMMVPHHRQAVEMAELADTRAADAEVKHLAVQIKGAQGPEIATMTGWLTGWGRPVPPDGPGHGMPGMDHGMPGMMSDVDLTKLAGATGAEFDRQFLTMMIAHHEGAITMAREELAKGANADAKAMAQRIVTAQQGEIDAMNKILARL
ncbi:DUF305 domain-containing protein [Micromonospora rubida]|uniref:DUF305 domain-containing protein n=1 Tax=Micromonospora rubida TaxID=2697657 RepID=UPI002E298DFB|nr:DUF305 domain-containing protein [Micromonospora rubida]